MGVGLGQPIVESQMWEIEDLPAEFGSVMRQMG